MDDINGRSIPTIMNCLSTKITREHERYALHALIFVRDPHCHSVWQVAYSWRLHDRFVLAKPSSSHPFLRKMTNAARSIFNPLLFVSSRRPSQLSLIPLRRRRKMLVIPTLSSDLEAATSIPSGGGVDQKNSFHVTLTAKDEAQLATPDAEFKLQTWDDLKTIIGERTFLRPTPR